MLGQMLAKCTLSHLCLAPVQHPRLSGAHPMLRSNQLPVLAAHRCTPMSHLSGRWEEEGKEKEVPEDLISFPGQIQRLF